MLRTIGFLLFAIGLIFMLPQKYRKYRNEKEIADLFELISVIIMITASIILAFQ